MKPVTVVELIEHLKQFPQDLPVAYCQYSDYTLLELKDIAMINACVARPDGCIQSERPDMRPEQYLLFPGN